MKVAAAVLTYRAISTGRQKLCIDTLESLDEADAVFLVDNGSDDGSDEWAEALGGWVNRTGLHTSAAGNNLCARILAATDADVFVLSDDDMYWRPGWRSLLQAWWSEAPDDVALTGCHVEPAFPWNEIGGVVEAGGVRGLVRGSTGSASWSLPRKHLDTVFGPVGIPQQVQGYGDVPACDRVRDRGYRICQIDLAEHRGETSTWGNLTKETWGWDVEPVLELLRAS